MRKSIELWLELEKKCNLNCKFCYNYWRSGGLNSPSAIGTKDLLRCLDIVSTYANISKCTISGGEPLLRKDLSRILNYLGSFNCPLIITTNGILLTDQKINELLENSIKTFQIPLHSMGAETHNFLSGINCFDKTIEAILRLLSHNASVIPVFVATNLNLGHFGQVIEFITLIGLKNIIFNRVIPTGLALKNKTDIGIPTDDEIEHALISQISVIEENHATLSLGVPVSLKSELIKNSFSIKKASCPVKEYQTRWTLDFAGYLRRCNHSDNTVANVLNSNKLELESIFSFNQEIFDNHEMQNCQFLNTEVKYKVRV